MKQGKLAGAIVLLFIVACSGNQQTTGTLPFSDAETKQAGGGGFSRPQCWMETDVCQDDDTENYAYFSGLGEAESKRTARELAKIRARAALSSFLVVKIESEIESIVDCGKNGQEGRCSEHFSQTIINRSLSILLPSQLIDDDEHYDPSAKTCYYRLKIKRADIVEILRFAKELVAMESW